MKTKELFLLGFKSLKFLSLRKKIFLVIQIVIMLLILIPFGFYSVFSNAAETIINNQYEFREISLYGTSNDYEKYKSVLNEYENNHIVYIDELATPNIRAYTSVDSRNNFILKRKIEGFVPEVTNGNELNNKYDIICPEMATDVNFEELNYNDLINLEEKIGKTINLNFLNSDDELVFSQEFNIVGTYNADFYYSYDTCYILNNTFDEILSKINSDLKEDSDTVKDLFILYVDSNENVEEITNYLENNDIMVSVPKLDDKIVNYILLLSIFIMIILVITSIIILINYFKNYYKEEYYNIALYKALGFKEKDIIKIIFIENILLIFVALIVSIVLFIFLKIIVTLYLHQFVAFRIAEIRLSIIPLFIYYLVIILLNYVFLKIDINEISSMSIKRIGEL